MNDLASTIVGILFIGIGIKIISIGGLTKGGVFADFGMFTYPAGIISIVFGLYIVISIVARDLKNK